MNLKVDSAWHLRVNQEIKGNADIDFSYLFKSPYIAAFGSTTHTNPKRTAGYLAQMLNVPVLGGLSQINWKISLPNNFSKIIIFPTVSSDGYSLRFRFAFPVGTCQIKIWEYVS